MRVITEAQIPSALEHDRTFTLSLRDELAAVGKDDDRHASVAACPAALVYLPEHPYELFVVLLVGSRFTREASRENPRLPAERVDLDT